MQIDWSDFKKPHVVTGLVVALLSGLALAWYTVMHRIPDLETREDRQDRAIDEKFTAINGTLDKQFASVRGDMHDQLTALNLAVTGLRTNVILLCGRTRPISASCDIKALVSEAKRASQIQAKYFAAANVNLTEGSKQPAVADDRLMQQLPGYIITTSYADPSAPAHSDKSNLANTILWSSAANSARWHQQGNSVVVVFENGSASFDLSSPGTKEHVGDLEPISKSRNMYKTGKIHVCYA
jgi:hypothetical protein